MKIKEKEYRKELEKIEAEKDMKKKVEADYLYQVYQSEKWKQKQEKIVKISKENFKDIVRSGSERFELVSD